MAFWAPFKDDPTGPAPEVAKPDAEHVDTIMKVVEERLGERERRAKECEKRLRATTDRINECRDLIVATLTDAGHAKLAEHLLRKINGLYEAKP